MREPTFSERMIQSDRAGNIHGMSRTTYHRARRIWKERLSNDPEQATKAREIITQINNNTMPLGRATILLGLETPSSKRPPTMSRVEHVATIQRIAATLDGLAQATAGIRDLNSIGITPEETEELAARISKSCKTLSRIPNKLRRAQ
jgi:hypothetical protein